MSTMDKMKLMDILEAYIKDSVKAEACFDEVVEFIEINIEKPGD